jgi:hypothetical protein
MSDLRNLDLDEMDGGLKTYCLYKNADELTGGSANNNEYFGFYVGTVGGAWSFTPYDGKAAISFTPITNTYYNFHCSTITPHASGTGFGNLGGTRYNMVDSISSWTVDGDGDLTGGVMTVTSSNGSSALTSASSVLPVIGDKYEYTLVISSFGAATQVIISYGGVEMWDETMTSGTYTGTLTTTSGVGLVVDVDVATTSDFVLDSILIKRVK